MATTGQSANGYDCEFVESPPDDLKCLICLCVAKDPLQHGEGGCGKIYCRYCITEYKKTNNKCPNCRRTITTFTDVRSNRDIQSLRIKCENEQDGCQWVGELRSLEGHLEGCDFQRVPCPNKCTYLLKYSFGHKVIKIYRKDIKNHLKLECKRRQYTCPHCGEIGEHEKIMGWHIGVSCPKIKEECLNSHFGCEEIFPRERKDSHLSVCPYTKLDCKYKDFGCHVKPFRKDLEAHQNDDKLHLSITLNTLLVVQKQCAKLTEECGVLRTQQNAIHPFRMNQSDTPRITFKMSQFSKYKAKTQVYTSTPFFTHPEGYKVAIKIYANGTFGTYKGTHMTVSLHLMRGEYDDQLEFPFKGYFRIQLLNQLDDRNHCERTHSVNGNGPGCEKVEGRDKNIYDVTIIDNFIKHTNLSLNRPTNCQYLKDDCLVFRVFVRVPAYKPWLQCTTDE